MDLLVTFLLGRFEELTMTGLEFYRGVLLFMRLHFYRYRIEVTT